MIVYFINKAETTVTVELGNDKIKLNNGEKIKIDSETNRMRFNCYLNENSTFKSMPLFKSVIIEYNFNLNSSYDLTFYTDICEINLVQKLVRGNNLDCYKLVDLQFSGGNINSKEFFVQDELSAKNQLSATRKKEVKLEKKLSVIDILQSVCYIGIPALIIFFGIWYFSDLTTALFIIIPLTIIAVCVGLLLRKIISHFNDKLDKYNAKFEKEPDKFVDLYSYFDKSYIYSVISSEENN